MNNQMNCKTPRSMNNPFIRASFPGIFDAEIFGKEFSNTSPAVNVCENDKSWSIEVSAPGFKKDDFTIKLENDVLTIGASHKEQENVEQKNYSRREFKQTSFSRSFRLAKENVNEDGIAATYDNGILNLTIPKKEKVEKENLKEIKVS